MSRPPSDAWRLSSQGSTLATERGRLHTKKFCRHILTGVYHVSDGKLPLVFPLVSHKFPVRIFSRQKRDILPLVSSQNLKPNLTLDFVNFPLEFPNILIQSKPDDDVSECG